MHPRDDIVRLKCSTDGIESWHNTRNGWRPLVVGNQTNISLVVVYVAAWYYADVHRDQTALDYSVLYIWCFKVLFLCNRWHICIRSWINVLLGFFCFALMGCKNEKQQGHRTFTCSDTIHFPCSKAKGVLKWKRGSWGKKEIWFNNPKHIILQDFSLMNHVIAVLIRYDFVTVKLCSSLVLMNSLSFCVDLPQSDRGERVWSAVGFNDMGTVPDSEYCVSNAFSCSSNKFQSNFQNSK